MRLAAPASCVVFCIFLAADPSEAQVVFQKGFLHATDIGTAQPFSLNPAGHQPAGLEGGLLLSLGNHSSSFEIDRGSSLTKTTTESEDPTVGAGLGADLGAGLGFGLTHTRRFHESRSTSLTRSIPFQEFLTALHTSARLAIELSENVRLGVAFNFLESETRILGSFNASDDERTSYKSTLFGVGAGLAGEFRNLRLGLSLHRPLKGKTEIYGEEYIVGEPGVAEIIGRLDHGGKWAFGLAFRRAVYRADDRYFGTTLNDANSTSIDLFGLDPEKTTIFFKDEVQVGTDYKATANGTLRVSVARENMEFNFSPEESLVGESEDAQVYGRLRLNLSYFISRGIFTFEIGSRFHHKDHAFSASGRSYHYEGLDRDFFVTVNRF